MKTETKLLSPVKAMIIEELRAAKPKTMKATELYRNIVAAGFYDGRPNAFYTMLRRMSDDGLVSNTRARGGASTARVTRAGEDAFQGWLGWAEERLTNAGWLE